MHQRQIVIISGKTGTGKTGLAKVLHERYGFEVIATREILGGKLEMDDRADRPALIDQGRQADSSSDSSWIVESLRTKIASTGDSPGVVIDHVSTMAQVRKLRSFCGPNLVHVHLYATTETLLARYGKGEGGRPGAPAYEQIDHLLPSEVEPLKKDADVRIFTDRTDNEDTVVRVAAHLRLLTSPDVRCVDVLVGGQYGSEGKGNIVAFLANEYDVLLRVGGPNAGHTVALRQGKAVHHQLPSGTAFSDAKLLLGPGMTIDVEGLLREIRDFDIQPGRLFIDPKATIIEEVDREEEAGGVVGAIASTGSGSGAAKARRIRNRGNAKQPVRLARDVPELRAYLGSTEDHLELAYRGHSVLLEGTQGSALSLYHGPYPHVTSRDTNVAGCLAEAGISPSRVRKILMVVRTTPIRVGDPDGDSGNTSGHMKHETSFPEIAERSGLVADQVVAAEKTSTTKRNRRVGWFEWSEFRRACNLNAPTDIVLTFVDYISADNQDARRFEQLTPDTIKFIEELERVAQAPVSLINTRFPKDEGDFADLRSIIDRRNWSARSKVR